MYLLQMNQWMEEYFIFCEKSSATNNPTFQCYNTKYVVIMDNASIHHIDSVVAYINSVGALVRFLPPYSPDFKPIESVFGEAKQYLQASDLLLHTSLLMNTILMMAFS